MRYHRDVRLFEHTRRLIVACALAAGAVVSLASPARAATVPNGAIVCVDRAIDVAAFARLVSTRYHVVLQRVVAADIDRDGDLDVLASTDRGFLVWVNDGAGRLTSQAPKPHPAIDGQAPSDTWNRARPRDEETIQNDVPSPRLPADQIHAPPVSVSRAIGSSDVPLCPAAAHDGSAPRAPPSLL